MNDKPMKANISGLKCSSISRCIESKEQIRQYQGLVISRGKIINPVTYRVFMSRSRQASVIYSAIWIHADNVFGHGSGSAGGGGYDKVSASISDALSNAGIQLNKSINGRGEGAIRESIRAIIKSLGYSGKVSIID